MQRFEVITLCGSTKFKDEFYQVQAELTQQGIIVLSLGIFAHSDGTQLTDSMAKRLMAMHQQRIDMSDGIFVINKGGYIGKSTQAEITYATSRGKTVCYLEQKGSD